MKRERTKVNKMGGEKMEHPIESRWCVMKAYNWDMFSVTSNHPLLVNMPVNMPEGGPQKFIPVFDTREQAVAFDDGDETFVQELKTGKI